MAKSRLSQFLRKLGVRSLARLTVAILVLGVSVNAFSTLDTVKWREEVLLHDGKTLIVDRSKIYDAKGALEPASLEEEWTFRIPETGRRVTWKNNLRQPPVGSSLTAVALEIWNQVPYLATVPGGCIAYNYWGRPNPPYVFLKFDGEGWKRVGASDLPGEFREANVVIGAPAPKDRNGFLSTAAIKEKNRLLETYLRIVTREPIKVAQTVNCEELIYYKGGWISPKGTFGRDFMDRVSKPRDPNDQTKSK